MSSSYGHHAASGPSPGGQASFHPGAYSNISSLSPLRNTTEAPSQHMMGSSHSKSSNPWPVPSSSSFKAAISGGIGFKRVFASKRKKSLDLSARLAEHDLPRPPSSAVSTSPETLNINVKKSVVQHKEPLSSLPPPPPPKHPLPTVQSKSLNRESILPISPGILPAVDYMLQQQQQTTLSPEAIKTPTSQPQPQQSAPAPKEIEKVKLQNTPDSVEMKESWRKSDSTNSHTTVRPCGNGGSTRSSRPVSRAESFQSTHTVVQTSNKRLSALITDGMPEEDGESFVSVGDNSSSHPPMSIPPSSDRVKHRRSMSLNLGSPTNSKILIPPPLASASVTEFKHSLSQVVSPPTTLNTSPVQSSAPTRPSLAHALPSMSVDTGAAQQPRTSGVNNFRGKFAAWANGNLSSDNLSRQDRTLPSMPPQQRRPSLPHFGGDGGVPSLPSSTPTPLRQTTISMTGNGPGPVAAAKRVVEKMGRRWGMSLSPSTSGSGSGYSSSSSSMNAPSSFSSAPDYGLVRTSSNRSTPSVHSHIVKSSHSHGSAVGLAGGGGGKGRTPDAPSGTYSVHSLTSKSDNDPFASSGPSLGTMLRGGLRNKNGVVSSGVVFGKALKVVTRETGVNVGKEMGSVGGRVKEGLVLELERRLLPAIVVRCAQHLLIWGVQEEGLFRVSGRPSHVSKLRSEFDSGVDYDMTECSPGDLDPHAVASVFKAYLRELPESILTHTFSPLFDAAIKKEVSSNLSSLEANRSSGVGRGNNVKPGLPQGPKGGFAVRKPPSLSTLSMPTFSGIPPPSTSLVGEIKSLVSKLPQENYDLLRTVVDLVKATGKESTKTKMPLSNLMLVFCPSLNMAPPLLKVLCEAEDIWAEVMDSPLPPPLPLKDGQFLNGFKREEANVTDSSEEMEDDDGEDEVEEKSLMSSGRASLDTNDDPSSGYHASAEEEASLFEEGQIMSRRHLPERKTERSEIPTIYLDTMSHYSSSSIGSLREPLEPSGHHHYHGTDSKDSDDDGSISGASGLVPPVLSPSTPLCSSSAESVAHPTSEASASLLHLQEGVGKIDGVGPIEIVDPDAIPISLAAMTTPTKKASIGHPSSTNDDDAVQFPQLPSTPSVRLKRISIPLLSYSPSFIASSGDADRRRDDDSPPTSPSSGVHMLGKGSKRPSLRLLFSKSKKSGSSLNSLGDRSGNGIVVIPNPIQKHLSHSPAWDSGTSDSSGSTPLSAVTAASSMSSVSHLPPVLDTPIDGSPLSLDLRFASSPPDTAIPDRAMREQQKLDVDVDVASSTPTVTPAISECTRLEDVQTPIASRLSETPPYPGTMIPAISYSSLNESLRSSTSLSVLSLSLQTPSSDSGLAISSTHSPQLSLLDECVEEDWTQSVLSAADKL